MSKIICRFPNFLFKLLFAVNYSIFRHGRNLKLPVNREVQAHLPTPELGVLVRLPIICRGLFAPSLSHPLGFDSKLFLVFANSWLQGSAC